MCKYNLELFLYLIIALSANSSLALSVDQLYFELPDELLGNHLIGPDSPSQWPIALRKKLIKDQNLKTGYLLLTSGVEIVSINRSGKENPILFISGDSYADGSRGVGGRLSIFSQDPVSRKWVDLSEQLAPKVSDMVVNALFQKQCQTKKSLMDSTSGTYKYILPKVGRKFTAVIDSDIETKCKKPLFELEFFDNKFHMTIL